LTQGWEKLVKIGVKVVDHPRYVAFQKAEVAISTSLFAASWPAAGFVDGPLS